MTLIFLRIKYNYLFRFFLIRFSMNNLRRLLSAGGDDGIRTHDPLLAGQVLSQLSYTPKLLGICCFSVFTFIKRLVGPSGLEPPTSCLSGTRSNLLSYDPMWLVWLLCSHSVLSEPRADFSALFSVLALSYLPVPLPAKYFRHCRA